MVAVSGASLVDGHLENRARPRTIHVYEPLDQAGRGKLQSGGKLWLAIRQGLAGIPWCLGLCFGSLRVPASTKASVLSIVSPSRDLWLCYMGSVRDVTYPGRERQ